MIFLFHFFFYLLLLMTTQIVLTSNSDLKKNAVILAMDTIFPDLFYKITKQSVNNLNLPEQPINKQGYDCCLKRLNSIDTSTADIIISIENYIDTTVVRNGYMYDYVWVMVKYKDQKHCYGSNIGAKFHQKYYNMIEDPMKQTVGMMIHQVDNLISQDNWMKQMCSMDRIDMIVDTLKPLLMIVKNHMELDACVPTIQFKGVDFFDVMPLVKKGNIRKIIQKMVTMTECVEFDAIAGLESRGFIFGTPVAYECDCDFIPIRKPNKLPGKIVSYEYKKEYGSDTLVIQEDAITQGMKVLLVDDVIATGGSLEASRKLVEKCGGEVVGCLIVKEVECLKDAAKEKLGDLPVYIVLPN